MRKTLNILILLAAMAVIGWSQSSRPEFNEDRTRLLINEQVLLDSQKDGFMHLSQIRFAPDGKHFLVLACGFECNDNVGFIFDQYGTNKRQFTGRWDWILQDKVEWSADSRYVFYYRINSSGAEPPAKAPAEGWMQVQASNGAKAIATKRILQADATYAVFQVAPDDALNLRFAPNVKAKIIGRIPADGKGIVYAGATRRAGKTVWAKVKFGEVTGWVNQSYLYEESAQ